MVVLGIILWVISYAAAGFVEGVKVTGAGAGAGTATGAAAGTSSPFTIPEWDYKMLNDSACIITDKTNQTNNRWTHYALPKGTAPKGGWPV